MENSEEMLSTGDKRDLLRFCCSMAWSDGYVQEEEKEYIQRLIEWLDPRGEFSSEVDEWLEEPGGPELLDPSRVPEEHREFFLDECREIIESDAEVTKEEEEFLEEFESYLFPDRFEEEE